MQFDLVIVGGGLVGASLAVALRQTDLNIALIDARLPSADDPRLFALNYSCCQLLTNLNLFDKLAPHAAPIHEVHISHQGHFGAVRLDRSEVALPMLGHVIPACHIEAVLNETLTTLPRLTLFRPAKLESLTQANNMANLKIVTEEGSQEITTPIVIGADGTESTVRKQLNLPIEVKDYHQTAIVTRTTLKRPHAQVAYERFNKQGAIAMLPLSGNECATIWTTTPETAKELMSLDEVAFVQRLQQAFGYRLGRLQSIHQRHMFPLRGMQVKKKAEQCIFLLGNAAHTLHPIAAQGFNLSMYEVATLVEGIMQKTAKQEKLTAADLQTISVQTEKLERISMDVSNHLSELFTTPSALTTFMLQAGMVGFDIVTPLKRKFMQWMMGRFGKVPALLVSSEYATG